jgi:hypothetical protein
MTVAQLRAACKARGLPAWQSKGKRLRKADLVAQLRASERRAPRPTTSVYDVAPVHAARPDLSWVDWRAIERPMSFDELCARELSRLTVGDMEYARAMERYMRNPEDLPARRVISTAEVRARERVRAGLACPN